MKLKIAAQKAIVETATQDDDFYLVYTPVESPEMPHVLIFQTGILAALMASHDFKELAYSNAIAITNAITGNGFIPNLESGLDNSPMFEEARFNTENHTLELADVGLMGLYVADCNYLAEIAGILGKTIDSEELKTRSKKYAEKLQELWDEKTGIFRDKYTDTNVFSVHLSLTNFYPLLGKVATQQQAERMIKEHFTNPNEFYGEWMLPSISRNDPAYPDNEYWRGRIWAPMNFLVYMGLRNYDLPEARKILSDKSYNLIMKEWSAKGRVHENYNAETGEGDDVRSSDSFYLWGGLLGLIPLMEEGYFFNDLKN